MSYEHDIFISYRNVGQSKSWVENIFIEQLRHCLELELGEVKIFWDRDINPGNDWPSSLGENLAKSKVLIPLFSRQYFTSEWCKLEFQMIQAREEALGLSAALGDQGLIFPATVHDGDHLPQAARRIQMISLNNFFNPYLATGSKRLEEMMDIVSGWSCNIVRAIEEAPPYDEDWLNINLASFSELYNTENNVQISVPRMF